MFKKIGIIIILMLICNPVFADVYNNPAKISDIITQLPQLKNIKCKFKQEKYLANITKPLISGGDFEFVKNKGVFFYTKYPITSTADYTNKNYKQINSVIKAISSGKYNALEKEFLFYFEGTASDWNLGMKPKTNSYAYEHISYITVSGSDYIKQINIVQTNGNKTVIWFTK